MVSFNRRFTPRLCPLCTLKSNKRQSSTTWAHSQYQRTRRWLIHQVQRIMIFNKTLSFHRLPVEREREGYDAGSNRVLKASSQNSSQNILKHSAYKTLCEIEQRKHSFIQYTTDIVIINTNKWNCKKKRYSEMFFVSEIVTESPNLHHRFSIKYIYIYTYNRPYTTTNSHTKNATVNLYFQVSQKREYTDSPNSEHKNTCLIPINKVWSTKPTIKQH
jgi:hypothetical protein